MIRPGVTVPSLADAPEGVVLTLGAALLARALVGSAVLLAWLASCAS